MFGDDDDVDHDSRDNYVEGDDDDDVDHDSRDNVADGDNADGGDDEQEEDEGTFGINYTTV